MAKKLNEGVPYPKGIKLPPPVYLEHDRPTTTIWKTRTIHFLLLALSLLAVRALFAQEHSCWDLNGQHHLKGHHLWALSAFVHHTGKDEPLRGKRAEELFLTVPNVTSALTASRAYARHPHLAGSPEDLSDAKAILSLFQTHFNITPPSAQPIFSAGTVDSRNATLNIPSLATPSAWIDVYYPVLNTPLDRSLEILDDDGTALWTADLVEDGDPQDPEAEKYRDFVPTWHGLSKGGDVQGQIVYANYGSKEDYDHLVRKGANVTGKIVLTRYGGLFRGLKIKGAEELGAAGVLIYSDPRDDGFVTVENGYGTYPAGPARNPTSVQRGSVQYLSIYPGDPTTPGEPAYQNATRTDGANIPNIPSLPISWENAQILLAELGGNEDGRKITGISSERVVRLVNNVDNKVTPIWNTMAAIPGHIKDEIVLIGNHRDAWVMGAADPTSGTVSIHEVVRGFGTLLRHGWKPLRTIVFASWDGEEYGLIGSTEWGEDFPEWISSHVVAYLNLDVAVSGSRFNTGASPSLANLLRKAAEDVPHPTDPGRTLWEASEDQGPFDGPADDEFMTTYRAVEQKRLADSSSGVAPLGSGSDYTVFLQRLGVASSDEGFSFTPSDAVYHYHSIYDSERWQEEYADPGFERHVAVAKHLGLSALRLIDAVILPLNTTQYAFELDSYLDTVKVISSVFSITPNFTTLEQSIAKLQNASLALDVEIRIAEKNFLELLKKLRDRRKSKIWKPLRRLAHRIKKYLGVHRANGDRDSDMRKFIEAAKRVQRANQKLISFERGFISEKGIKDREWYRNLVVAPGKWLGYGATTLPALTEAITIEGNLTLAQYESDRLASLIDNLSQELKV